MLNKFITFYLLLGFFISGTALAAGKNADDFLRVIELEQKIKGTHNFNFISGGKTFPMNQVIKASYCQVAVHTYAQDIGIVFSDKYDMIKNFAFRRPGKYRGTYGTYVGAKSLLKGKWKIYFNDREKRDLMASKLRKLSYLCKKPKIRKAYRKIQKEQTKETKWVGNIFNGESHTRSLVRTSSENRVASLDGRQGLIERIQSMENAKESIYLQYMIFRADPFGKYFAQKLMDKKAEGIDVRVIVDALGSGPMDITQAKEDKINTPKMLRNLMAAGIRVFGFNCDGTKGIRGLIKDEMGGIDFTKLIRRHHEKVWLVDSGNLTENSVAIIGGANITQEYFSLTGEDARSWKDQDIAAKGPIVKDFRSKFLSNWVESSVDFKSYNKDKKCFNTYDPISQKTAYEKFKRDNTLEYASYTKKEDIEADKTIQRNIKRYLDGEKYLPNLFLNEDTRYRNVEGLRVVHADPEAGENYTHEAYVKLIGRAQKEIYLANAYFNPPEDLLNALKDALRRGVKIKFYTNGEDYNDLPLFTLLGRQYYLPLYEAAQEVGLGDNLEIYEWDGTRNDNKFVSLAMAHTKYMIIDGQFGVIGSQNLNYSSMSNSEILLLFDGEEISRDYLDQFEFDLEFTKRISPEQMKEFKKPKKLKDRIKNFFITNVVGKLA